MIIIEQIVDYQRVLDAIHIDRRAAFTPVIMDAILADMAVGHHAVAAKIGVPIEMNARGGIVMQVVAADGEMVAAVIYVDAMFAIGITFIVL
jgi:hypothetical protein